MHFIDCVWLSPEWWQARCGVVTASNADRIVTPGGKLSAQSDGYINELVAERLCGIDPNVMTERPMNAAMRHGVACEPEARRWYEMHAGVSVKQVGFILSDCGWYGCSPDGVIGDNAGLELKCPQGNTHVCYLLGGELPVAYKPQVHFQLLVTGWEYVDFVSYHQGMRPLVVRVRPDAFTEFLKVALDGFLVRLKVAIDKVRGGA